MTWPRRLAIVTLALFSACEKKLEPLATASRISSVEQLIGGPRALGTIGDYLLENDQIRVIIHGPGANRGSTFFGGSILDADLQRPGRGLLQGNDLLGEITPAFFLESFNPDSFEVINDPSKKTGVVRVEGRADDFLQAAHALNLGLLFSPDLRFRIDYKLAPGQRYVDIETTIFNKSEALHPLPFLNPKELGEAFGIDSISQLETSVPFGHLLMFGESSAAFLPGRGGFDDRFAIEEAYTEAAGLPAFPGLVTDFVATRGEEVSYGLTVPAGSDNYVSAFGDRYQNQDPRPNSMLIPFKFAAVLAAFHTNPPSVLLPGQAFTYHAYFMVGTGDVASVASTYYQLTDTKVGQVTGDIFDAQTLQGVSHASIVFQDEDDRYVSQADTDHDGAFSLELPPGSYSYRIVDNGRPTTSPRKIEVKADGAAYIKEIVTSPATVSALVVDEKGRPAPAKISIVGRFDAKNSGRPAREFLYDRRIGEPSRTTSFDPSDNQYIEDIIYTSDGRATFKLRPGDYELVASRGPEYELTTLPLGATSGSTHALTFQLKRAFDTPGYVSADMHLHSTNSVDSSLSLERRVRSVAGEGIEYAVATDHNFVTDYQPAIAATNLTEWLASSVGVEVTTFEMGHFNGYPLRVDPSSIRGGDILWAANSPAAIFEQIRQAGRYGPDNTVVQVNHGRQSILGYFNAFNISVDDGLPKTIPGVKAIFSPYGPEFALEQYDPSFDAMELINGTHYENLHNYVVPDPPPPPPYPEGVDVVPGEVLRDERGDVAYPGDIETWFAFLNLGLTPTGVGCSDSHADSILEEPGYARTYVYVGQDKDQVGKFHENDAVRGIKSHRASVSLGAFAELFVEDQPMGSLVSSTQPEVKVRVVVKAASWSKFSHITLWVNRARAQEIDVSASEQTHFDKTFNLPLADFAAGEDAWVVVEVQGNQSMFPVLAPREIESLQPDQVLKALGASFALGELVAPYGKLTPELTYRMTSFAISNPVWIDRNNNQRFDPVITPTVTKAPAASRTQPKDATLSNFFQALPDELPGEQNDSSRKP